MNDAGKTRVSNGTTDWSAEPLWKLTAFITGRHHTMSRGHVATLRRILDDITATGHDHSEIRAIDPTLRHLGQALESHMAQEEQVLFPWLGLLEQSSVQRRPVPAPFFGSVERLMAAQEHEPEEQHLAEIRSISAELSAADHDCDCFSRLHHELERFAAQLREHIQLEKQILFPRAVLLEQAAV